MEYFESVPEINGYERVFSDMSEKSFELPSVGFILQNYETAAMEVEMCFQYCGDNTGEDAFDFFGELMSKDIYIHITVQDADTDSVPTIPCAVGKMTAMSDGWVKKWRDGVVRYYKFTDNEDMEMWLMASAPENVLGTPLQAFLDKALDHAAETFTE
ncbi:MAG: hypothetical protein K6B74_02840 [Ruminococcus sp.]|nr:hypothetical protein [Ruminococcus sp.]